MIDKTDPCRRAEKEPFSGSHDGMRYFFVAMKAKRHSLYLSIRNHGVLTAPPMMKNNVHPFR